MTDISKVKSRILANLNKINCPGNEIVGFVSEKGDVYTVGSDSK